MSLLRPLASLTGSLLVRNGNPTLAGWALPPPAPPLASPPPSGPTLAPRQWPEGLRLAEKGKARPSIMTSDDEGEPSFDMDLRISFRIDAERHRKLRLVVLQQGRSRQQLLVAALDAFLEADARLEAGRS
jgi:hypothetical protein